MPLTEVRFPLSDEEHERYKKVKEADPENTHKSLWIQGLAQREKECGATT